MSFLRIFCCLGWLGLWSAPALGAPALSAQDLLAVKWISQVTLAPDGRSAAFVISTADTAKNKRSSNIYLVSLGSKPHRLRQLTNQPGSNSAPAFSPDGKQLAFISNRGGKTPQLWLIALDGGEAQQLTSLSTGAGGTPLWSPDGKWLAFVADVFPQCKDDRCNAQRLKQQKKSKVKAQLFDTLLIRHWNHWRTAQRAHIFVVPAAGGQPRDLTPGVADAPPLALGGNLDYAFSPDSKQLAYVKNPDSVVAISTNNDIFEVSVAGGKAQQLTTGKGNDNSPRYSPDGRYLAYLSMARAGYESDRPQILVRDRKTGAVTDWSRGYSGHPLELLWAPNSKSLYFNAPHKGYNELFVATAKGVRPLGHKHYAKGLNLSADGRRLVFAEEAAHRPPEVYQLDLPSGQGQTVTELNGWLTQKRGLLPAEHHWFVGANDHKIHAVLVKPPGFKQGKTYPALVMIHGGPQGMTGDSFHPRWNLQMFAAMGYVVFGINFHGSIGFGQDFTDAIRGDWGGKPYQDILKGTEYLAQRSYVKPRMIGAVGASYGGYMVNWIATQTQRFSCLISHAGPYNLESKYGSTEELWFPEWDLQGTPWTNRALYRKWSPHSYAEGLKTPTLVIHGQLDYRVPVEQGLQMYTALKRQGIEAQLLYFPDEDHFVQKPQNVVFWWQTMQQWLARYLK